MLEDNTDFLEKKTELFDQVDQERKIKEQENRKSINPNDEKFINALPDWDLPPLYEGVRRVVRRWLIMNGLII